MTTIDDVRELRAAMVREKPDAIPCGQARSQPFASTLRASLVKVDGVDMAWLEGYASIVERGYEMWDFAGPYTEIMAKTAFDVTLTKNPDVAFLVNHKGVTMARSTTPGRLELAADDTGLKVTALVNPKRQDVQDLLVAVNDGDVDEMSFAFMITRGEWNSDYTLYRIDEVDLDRGDVSAVNYGANPYTSIAARSREILESLDHLPAGAARAALERLNGRSDMRPEPEPEKPAPPLGRSISMIRAGLLLDDEDR